MLFYMLIIRTLIAELKQKSTRWCRPLKIILFIPTVHTWAGSAFSQPGDRDACRQPSSRPERGAAEGWPAERAAQHLPRGVPSHCSEYHLPPNSTSSNYCLPIPAGFGFAHFLLQKLCCLLLACQRWMASDLFTAFIVCSFPNFFFCTRNEW